MFKHRGARGRQRVASLVLAALLLLATALSVSADTTPYLIQDVPQRGMVVGNKAGSYAAYQVVYPGGRAELRIDLTMALPDPTFANQAGMRVYGPYGYTSRGAPQEGAGAYTLWYRANDPATLYLQVYNYSRATIPYEIEVSGIGATAATTAEPQAPEAVSAPAAKNGAIAGTLMGNRGGAFAEHKLTFTGAEGPVKISMACQPTEPSLMEAFGFELWSPSGKRIANGTPHKSDPHGTVSDIFAPDVAGEYLLKVSNYSAGAQLTYRVTVVD